MYKINTEFEEAPMETIVGDAKTSGRVYVPREIIGRKVVIACIPDKTGVTETGMSTDELVAKLTDALDMSMDEWYEIVKRCELIGGLQSSMHPDEVSYNDAVDEMLDCVRSSNVDDMSMQQAFCFGAFVGITYRPHMMKEFDTKFANALLG